MQILDRNRKHERIILIDCGDHAPFDFYPVERCIQFVMVAENRANFEHHYCLESITGSEHHFDDLSPSLNSIHTGYR